MFAHGDKVKVWHEGRFLDALVLDYDEAKARYAVYVQPLGVVMRFAADRMERPDG